MVGKVLLFPLVLVKNVVMLIVRILRLGLGSIFGIIRFACKHTLGTAIAAGVGFVLWKKHAEMKEEEAQAVPTPEPAPAAEEAQDESQETV